jgi:hypothetical protein
MTAIMGVRMDDVMRTILGGVVDQRAVWLIIINDSVIGIERRRKRQINLRRRHGWRDAMSVERIRSARRGRRRSSCRDGVEACRCRGKGGLGKRRG